MSDPRDEARDLNAAEHVLGVEDADARAASQARLRNDPAFAADVEAWEARLGPLAEDAPAEAPGAHVWTRIEQATGDNVIAALPRPAAKPVASGKGVNFWRGWAMAASAVAAAALVGVFMLTTPKMAPAPHHMVAKVMGMDGKPDVVVSYTTGTKNLMLTPVGDMPPKGMTPRMWLMRKDGSVMLVGDVDMAHPERKQLNPAMADEVAHAKGVMISLEEAGRQPGRKPSGPMVAKGMFSLV
ncbi:MAG: anti-sigma factor [Proteobacteria bacterium]|nr:anti-sigma factor [Pseudomonadota bacterium]